MRHLSRFLVIVLVALTAHSTQSQSPAAPPADQLQRAAAAFGRSDWAAASAAYDTLARAYPHHALSRFRYGVTLMELGKLQDAEASLRSGEAQGVPAAQAAFRLAQLFAQRNQADSAIAELKRAAANQLFLGLPALDADPHFARVRLHARWTEARNAIDAVVRPCMYDAHFREFDFWVGDWDVRPTAGAPAQGPPARNTVTLNYNGCVVIEHWKAPSGSEGESYNLFDRSFGEWRQTWVDNIGGQHDYHGTLVGRNMVYTGDTPAAGGQRGRIPTRLTFFNISPDSVRQFSETSPDSGRTWQTAYDLMYVRRKDGAKP